MAFVNTIEILEFTIEIGNFFISIRANVGCMGADVNLHLFTDLQCSFRAVSEQFQSSWEEELAVGVKSGTLRSKFNCDLLRQRNVAS